MGTGTGERPRVEPMPARPEVLGLIAGSRSLPLLLAQQVRAAGVPRVVAVGFEGETDPALAALVDELVWVKVGQLDRLIRTRDPRSPVPRNTAAPASLSNPCTTPGPGLRLPCQIRRHP